MAKTRTSAKRARSSRKRKRAQLKEFKVSKVDPLGYLTNEENVGLAILDCLRNNDPEGVMEVVGIYLNAMNKAKLIEEGEISKSTLYHSLKSKNPTIKTLAKIVSSCSHVTS